MHLAPPGDHVKSQFALRATLRSVVGDKFCCKKLPRNFPPSGDGLAVATDYKPTKLQNTKGICHWRWLGHSILHDAPDSLIRSVLTSSANLCFLRWNIYAILWINSLIIKSTNFFIFYVPLEGLEVNNGHFLGAMGYDGFFPREPLASMVFRWFCSPLTITINYFFNNWPLDSMVFQWFWGHSTMVI